MKLLKIDNKTIVALLVMLTLMLLTRSYDSFTGVHLPDFTIPALFIAGVYFRHWLVPTVLIVFAVAIDNYAIVEQGVSANCITPAYTMLPLAYLGVYWAAKYINTLAIKNASQLVNVVLWVAVIGMAEWLFSTATYYVFAGTNWANFPSYVMHWAPMALKYLAIWMVVIVTTFTINYHLALITYFKTSKG